MTKFTLDPNPTFSVDVDIPIPGEKSTKVKFTFRHRTRDALEKFISHITENSPDETDIVMDIAAGWELQDEFTRENITRLLQNYHGAAAAISTTYINELSAARLGN